VVDATKLDDTGIVPVGQVDTGRGLEGGGYSEVRWYWYGRCQEVDTGGGLVGGLST
jgi:hypothetical protein